MALLMHVTPLLVGLTLAHSSWAGAAAKQNNFTSIDGTEQHSIVRRHGGEIVIDASGEVSTGNTHGKYPRVVLRSGKLPSDGNPPSEGQPPSKGGGLAILLEKVASWAWPASPSSQTKAPKKVVDGGGQLQPVVFDPSSVLTEYHDYAHCGPRGDDAGADLSQCKFGHRVVVNVANVNWKIVATVKGCRYFAYKIYACNEAPTRSPTKEYDYIGAGICATAQSKRVPYCQVRWDDIDKCKDYCGTFPQCVAWGQRFNDHGATWCVIHYSGTWNGAGFSESSWCYDQGISTPTAADADVAMAVPEEVDVTCYRKAKAPTNQATPSPTRSPTKEYDYIGAGICATAQSKRVPYCQVRWDDIDKCKGYCGTFPQCVAWGQRLNDEGATWCVIHYSGTWNGAGFGENPWCYDQGISTPTAADADVAMVVPEGNVDVTCYRKEKGRDHYTGR